MNPQSNIQNIAYAESDFFEPLLPGYEIEPRDVDIHEDSSYVKKTVHKKTDSEDDDLAIFSLLNQKIPISDSH
ncbi:MAG: hypothetical protein FK734_07975 [Asgard group archaeon]|nr:hypothetical protein [Asgard group archaeon]